MKNTTRLALRVTAFIGITLLFAACTSSPKVPTSEESQAVIMKKISTAAERWSNSDASGYAEMAAPDQTYMDDIAAPKVLIGSENIAAYLKNLAEGVPAHTAKLSDFNWQFYDDIVLVTYRYRGVFDGQPADPWKVTSVWRYYNGDWLSVHENWTEVKNQ